jgi:ERCC4-type nuclease
LRLVLDTREPALAQHLGAAADEVRQLDVGDAHLVDEDGAVVLMLERKTLPDLTASIKDGRFREQRCRATAAVGGDASRLAYVIEGAAPRWSDAEPVHGLDASAVRAALARLQAVHGCAVWFTRDARDTAGLLAHLRERLGDYVADRAANARPYHECVQVAKSANRDPRCVAVLQLAQLPGVTAGSAARVLDELGADTLGDLVRALDAMPSHEEAVARVAAVRRTAGDGRRLGPALAKTLVSAFRLRRGPLRDDPHQS